MNHTYPYFDELSETFRGAYTVRRLACLIASVCLIFLLTINSSWKATPDSALYLELGESLASGKGYVYNGSPHTYVPPGYPFILSLWINLTRNDFLHYRILMAILGMSSAMLGMALIFRLCGPDVGIVVGGLFAINHTIVSNSTYTSSDIPFTVLCLISFHVVCWAAKQGDSYVPILVAAIVSGLPALVRINGLGIPPALAIFIWSSHPKSSVSSRSIRCLLFLVIAFCLPAAWEYYKLGFPVSTLEGEYFRAVSGRSFQTQFAVVVNAAWEYLFETAYALTGISMRAVLLESMLAGCIMIGLIRAIGKGERLLSPVFIIQAAGLLLSSAGSRYLAPLLPALYLFLGLGVLGLAGFLRSVFRSTEFHPHKLVTTIFVIIAVTNLGANIQTIYGARTAVQVNGGAESSKDAVFFTAAKWIKEHDPDGPILSMNPRILRYLTGARTIDILRSGVPEHQAWVSSQQEISDIMEKEHPRYLFADSKNTEMLQLIFGALKQNGYGLVEIKEAGSGLRFSLWKITEPGLR